MGAVWVGRVGTGRGLDRLDSVQAFVLSTARGWRLSQEVGRRKEARRGAAHEGSCRLRYGGESLSWEGGALPKGLPLGGAVIGSAIAPSAPASPSRAPSPPPAPASSSPSVTSPSGSSRAAGAAPRQAPCQPPPYATPFAPFRGKCRCYSRFTGVNVALERMSPIPQATEKIKESEPKPDLEPRSAWSPSLDS